MGMDVYGIKPKNQDGEYFRANVWYWHPLWAYFSNLHPVLANKVDSPHNNSGDGLNARDSLALSIVLKRDIDSGITEQYIKDYYSQMENLPLEDCRYCEQTGKRSWIQENGNPTESVCNVCNGSLKVKNFAIHYHMDLDLMKEFQLFLENCNGFQIC